MYSTLRRHGNRLDGVAIQRISHFAFRISHFADWHADQIPAQSPHAVTFQGYVSAKQRQKHVDMQ